MGPSVFPNGHTVFEVGGRKDPHIFRTSYIEICMFGAPGFKISSFETCYMYDSNYIYQVDSIYTTYKTQITRKGSGLKKLNFLFVYQTYVIKLCKFIGIPFAHLINLFLFIKYMFVLYLNVSHIGGSLAKLAYYSTVKRTRSLVVEKVSSIHHK